MGIHSGKFYDAKKMQEYCDMMKNAASKYNDEAELTHSDYDGFHTTEKFMGITADAMKTLIKSGLGNNLSVVSETHGKMKTAQEEVITMFEEMVDHSQNARIEYDTLEMINNFYKDLYYEFKDIAANVKKLVDGLNEEFGNYAYFEQPDSQSALDAFIDFCGGEDDSAGYIKKCQNKFVAFDEAAKEYLKARDTVTRATKIDTNIINCISTLSAPIEGKSAGGKIELTSVKNVVENKAENIKEYFDLKKIFGSKYDSISYFIDAELRKKYGLSFDEILYLIRNNPELIEALYEAAHANSGEADKIMAQIDEVLVNRIVNKYKNEDSWDMEALGRLINQGEKDISKREYKALIIIFDQLTDEEKGQFITSAYTRSKVEEDPNSLGGGKGYYKYTISEGFQAFTSIYLMNQEDYSEEISQMILDGNNENLKKIQNSYMNGNILYTYSFLASEIKGANYDDNILNGKKLPDKDFEIKVMSVKTVDGKETQVSTIATYKLDGPTPSTKHACLCNSTVFSIYPYESNISNSIVMVNNNMIENLKPNKRYVEDGTWNEIESIAINAMSSHVDDCISGALNKSVLIYAEKAQKYIPIVGTMISVVEDVSDIEIEKTQDKILTETLTNVQDNNCKINEISKLQISGTVIGTADGEYYITNAHYDKTQMEKAFREYNNVHENKLEYDEKDFLERLFNDEDYYNSLADGEFFDYYDTYEG